MEVWKKLKHDFYGDVYEISNKGNIRRISTTNNMKGSIKSAGYLAVSLCKQSKTQTLYIHRLVADTFLDNPLNLTIVNHKDNNKSNNCVENLEWISTKESVKSNVKTTTNCLKVRQLTLDGDFIAEYDSIMSAATLTNSIDKHISSVCKGKKQTHNGFKWEYVDKIVNNMPTVYKEISGYDNYLITPVGTIYNKKYNQYMKPHKTSDGNLSVALSDKGVKDFFIHQLVATSFIPNPNNKQFVKHINGCKDDNRVENLEWITMGENIASRKILPKKIAIIKKI